MQPANVWSTETAHLAVGAQALLARKRLSERVPGVQQLRGRGDRALVDLAPHHGRPRLPRRRSRQEALLLAQHSFQAAAQLLHSACHHLSALTSVCADL